jgi:uncharacterized protein (DUF488 family)
VVLYTIGYESLTVEKLLTRLVGVGVSTLVDVRETPSSRKRGLSKGPLAQAASAIGLTYVHVPELGNSQRKNGRTNWDCEEFRAHVSHDTQALDRVIGLLERRCCLLCYEKNASECHRSIVADEIQRRLGGQIEVVHL